MNSQGRQLSRVFVFLIAIGSALLCAAPTGAATTLPGVSLRQGYWYWSYCKNRIRHGTSIVRCLTTRGIYAAPRVLNVKKPAVRGSNYTILRDQVLKLPLPGPLKAVYVDGTGGRAYWSKFKTGTAVGGTLYFQGQRASRNLIMLVPARGRPISVIVQVSHKVRPSRFRGSTNLSRLFGDPKLRPNPIPKLYAQLRSKKGRLGQLDHLYTELSRKLGAALITLGTERYAQLVAFLCPTKQALKFRCFSTPTWKRLQGRYVPLGSLWFRTTPLLKLRSDRKPPSTRLGLVAEKHYLKRGPGAVRLVRAKNSTLMLPALIAGGSYLLLAVVPHDKTRSRTHVWRLRVVRSF